LFPNKRAIDGEGDLEEERRLFYVASTRAERSLHLVFPMLSSQNGTQIRLMQSRFLKELPQTGYELYNVHAQNSFGQQSGYGNGSKWSQYGGGKRGGGYRRSY
jgi:DNA helicase-2/ATP-dependent DNA helicase PcrA